MNTKQIPLLLSTLAVLFLTIPTLWAQAATPTFTAAEQAQIDRFTADFGRNVQWRNAAGLTLLHLAAGEGNTAVVRYLISQGADANARNNRELTPLDFARTANHTAVVRYLESVARAGMVFTVAEQAEIDRFIAERGSDVRAVDSYGNTLLHGAVFIRFDNNTGQVGMWDVAVAKYLVSQGADVNAKNSTGFTPLHHAAKFDNNVEVVKFLISVGADMNAKSERGETPLDIAKTRNRTATIGYLEGIGAQGAAVASPSATDIAPFVVAAIVIVDDRPQCWIRNRTSGQTYRLFEGETFTLGSVTATVQKIDAESGQVQVVAGRLYTAGIGQSFTQSADGQSVESVGGRTGQAQPATPAPRPAATPTPAPAPAPRATPAPATTAATPRPAPLQYDFTPTNFSTKSIAYVPGPDRNVVGWVQLYGRNSIRERNAPDDLMRKIREITNARQTINSIAFNPDGGWIIIYNRNQRATNWDSAWENELGTRLDRLRAQRHEIKSVAICHLTAEWCIIWGRNGWQASLNVPQDLEHAIREVVNRGQAIHSVSFGRLRTGWIMLHGNGGFHYSTLASGEREAFLGSSR